MQAPLLKGSVAGTPGLIRRHFAAAPGAPLADFARIALDCPDFALQAVTTGAGTTKAR